MNMIEQRTIAGVTYNIAQAPAVKQKTLLTLIGGKITFNAATTGHREINVPFLKGALLTIPEATFDKVAEIVLYKTVEAGSEERVTVENFQGGMNAYLELIAEAIAVNLADFFTWLDSVNAEQRAAAQPAGKAE